MKKNLTILFLILVVVDVRAQRQAVPEKPHGIFWQAGVAFGGTFPKDDPKAVLELFTTFGYRFSRTFSLGAGVSTYNTETLNVYALTRFNLRHPTEARTHFPYIALRGGYAWSTWTSDHWGDDKGPILDLQLGWSFFTPEGKLRWSVYLSPGLYQYEFIPKAGLCFEF